MRRGTTVEIVMTMTRNPDSDPVPALARWKLAGRPEALGDEKHEIGDGHEQPNDVDGIHTHLRRGGRTGLAPLLTNPYDVSRLRNCTLTP